MTHYRPEPISEQTLATIREFAASGATQAELIAKMRDLGLYQGRTGMLLCQLTGISHNEAKRAVHFSPVWNDTLDASEALHQSVLEAARQLGAQESVAPEPEPQMHSAR